MEQEINIKEYVNLVRNNLKLILIIPIIAGICSGMWTYFLIKPTYEANTSILVQKQDQNNNSNSGFEYNLLLANKELIKTYSQIAQSRKVLNETINSLRLDMPYESLKGKVKVSSVNDSQILYFQVQDNDPQKATRIANKASQIFIEKIKGITGQDNLKIVDMAVVPTTPIKPNKLINILMGALLGLMAAVGFVFAKEHFDGTVKEAHEVEEIFGVSVLGSVPDVKDVKVLRLINMHNGGVAQR